jgi:signal transduction histidine kinase
MTSDEPGGAAATEAAGVRAPDIVKLELDELLTQLIDRAQDVRAAHGRLGRLLQANRMITDELDLAVVLRRIVEAACQMVNARYGALGVIGADGRLEQFIHVGIEDEIAEQIGHLPEGKGLLGALVDDPRPIRLHRIADDVRSVGFPKHHPAMATFLGVPIRVREAVFGNLYLTEREGGDFTAEDAELVASLAATAASAIENARLYDEAGRRQAWLEASGEVTRELFSVEVNHPLRMIAQRVHALAGADVVTVVLPDADGQRLIVEVATGERADRLTGLSYDADRTMARVAVESGRPVLLADASAQQEYVVQLAEIISVGPVMAVPLIGSGGARGALVVARVHGRHMFSTADLEMVTTFANHAAIALELADARADQQRVALLEDRDRIARDLHDHVIQRLFAAGLSVQSVAARLPDGASAGRLSQVIDDIDETIRQIRTSIFELRAHAGSRVSLRVRLGAVAAELTAALGFVPRMVFEGPVDTMTPADVADDVVAVVREGLTNVARHAAADAVTVTVAVADSQLSVLVADDGRGIGPAGRRSGLANLRARAEKHGGALHLREQGGTTLRWSVPLSATSTVSAAE